MNNLPPSYDDVMATDKDYPKQCEGDRERGQLEDSVETNEASGTIGSLVIDNIAEIDNKAETVSVKRISSKDSYIVLRIACSKVIKNHVDRTMETHKGIAAIRTNFQSLIPLMEINRASMQTLLSLSLTLSLSLSVSLF